MADYFITAAAAPVVSAAHNGSGKNMYVQFSVSGTGALAAKFKIRAAVTSVLDFPVVEEIDLQGQDSIGSFWASPFHPGVQLKVELTSILGSSAVATVVYEAEA